MVSFRKALRRAGCLRKDGIAMDGLAPLGDYVLDGSRLAAYLERIGLDGMAADVRRGKLPAADAATLAVLQQAHLQTVPFECLDIAAGKVPLDLSLDGLFRKIVTGRRGGICYEQNLLYAAVLQSLGYEVRLRAARHPKYGDDFDHIFLQVDIPGEPYPLLADVGFAVNFSRPLQLAAGPVQNDGRNRYRLLEQPDAGDGYTRLWIQPGLRGDGEWSEVFTFSPLCYQTDDYLERCHWYCTDAQSRFVQGPMISIDAPEGRKTLSARHYIVTAGDARTSVDVESPEQYEAYLHDEFGL